MYWKEIEALTKDFRIDDNRPLDQIKMLCHLNSGVMFAMTEHIDKESQYCLIYRDVNGDITHYKIVNTKPPTGL